MYYIGESFKIISSYNVTKKNLFTYFHRRHNQLGLNWQDYIAIMTSDHHHKQPYHRLSTLVPHNNSTGRLPGIAYILKQRGKLANCIECINECRAQLA